MELGKTRESQAIRRHLIDVVRSGRADLVADAGERFGISRQAVHRHLAHLVRERFLEATGTTRGRTYRLGPNRQQTGTYVLGAIAEDRVYASDFAYIVDGLGKNVQDISRVFDLFAILSGDLIFQHTREEPDDAMFHAKPDFGGTTVLMRLSPTSERTLASVFNEYTDAETLDFSKTIVPVRLALYEGIQLVSCSQAKRIMNRVERFRNVVLNFEGVDTVGRSFVDEIFRVFTRNHPAVAITPINMSPEVQKEVGRVLGADASEAD